MAQNNAPGSRRVVRMDRFKKQLEERVLPPDGLVSVDLGPDAGVIKMKVSALTADLPDDDAADVDVDEALDRRPFMERVVACRTGTELALFVLGFNPDRSAEEQWAAFRSAGYDAEDFALLFRAEMEAARERLGGFRYAG